MLVQYVLLCCWVGKSFHRSCSLCNGVILNFLAWSMAFEPNEVAIDEAVSMDASDVGWGDTPTTTEDTGWATFDSFTDIRMAPSRFVSCSV